MDYSENMMIVPESDLEYARWYSLLPPERKARMLADMFQFGVDSVRYNARKKNPYITDAEAMLCYFEKNLKTCFTPDVFEFIQQTMIEKAELEWGNRFKSMKKHFAWSYDEIAHFIHAESGNSVKSSVNRKLPALTKLAVCVFEAMKGKA